MDQPPDATAQPVGDRRRESVRSRQRADGSTGHDVRWSAVLVQAVRIDGKPRQRNVAFLASITESAIAESGTRLSALLEHVQFWDRVDERLNRLGDRPTSEERRRVEAAIARRVPRLSPEEYEARVAEAEGAVGEASHIRAAP
jgi:hypothetical protein